jgi:peroxiredoxin
MFKPSLPQEEISMARITAGEPAPDFELIDATGNPVRLSNYRDKASVVLVFNRGFQ